MKRAWWDAKVHGSCSTYCAGAKVKRKAGAAGMYTANEVNLRSPGVSRGCWLVWHYFVGQEFCGRCPPNETATGYSSRRCASRFLR